MGDSFGGDVSVSVCVGADCGGGEVVDSFGGVGGFLGEAVVAESSGVFGVIEEQEGGFLLGS